MYKNNWVLETWVKQEWIRENDRLTRETQPMNWHREKRILFYDIPYFESFPSNVDDPRVFPAHLPQRRAAFVLLAIAFV